MKGGVKVLTEYTAAELRSEIEHTTGLPCPPSGGADERELWAQHEVTSNFLLYLRLGGDPEAAKIAAAEYTLQHHAFPIGELVPHIERALGRKLLDTEIQTGTLYP